MIIDTEKHYDLYSTLPQKEFLKETKVWNALVPVTKEPKIEFQLDPQLLWFVLRGSLNTLSFNTKCLSVIGRTSTEGDCLLTSNQLPALYRILHQTYPTFARPSLDTDSTYPTGQLYRSFEEVTLGCIAVEEFVSLVGWNVALLFLLKNISDALTSITQEIESSEASRSDLLARLAELLLELSQQRNSLYIRGLKLSDFAYLLGADRDFVKIRIGTLRKLGVIKRTPGHYGRTIQIVDQKKLTLIARKEVMPNILKPQQTGSYNRGS